MNKVYPSRSKEEAECRWTLIYLDNSYSPVAQAGQYQGEREKPQALIELDLGDGSGSCCVCVCRCDLRHN